ncbi:histone-lysine n-methyltransferase atxr3 [Hordeum vulgare]|nr:histone-lysine n-methyltransferase atxr3 [Hordeum vulgare]
MPTPSPSPSPSPPPPPRMTEEEEAQLVQPIMEDSMNTYDKRQWEGVEEMMAGDVAILELEMADAMEEQPVAVNEEVHEEQPVAVFHPNLVGQRWTWPCTTTEMAQGVGAEPWCPTLPRSPEHESSPRGEVVQAPPAPPNFQGPPAHLWTMSPYIDLNGDDDDNDDA